MKEVFAVIAALLAVAGNLPYLWDIIKGRIQPHPYTWFVWSVVSCIIFFGQLTKGAGIGALPTAASEIFTLGIFILSLRYGFKGVRTTDTIFLVVALIGVALWVYTKDPTSSVVIAVGIDVLAFVPTLRKTWHAPDSETPILYGSNVVRHILALLSLQTYNIATMLHSAVMLVTNTLMTVIIVFRGWRHRNFTT